MEKVEAYRCEECNGTKRVESATKKGYFFNCEECSYTGIVWLTEEEVRDRNLIADHKGKDGGCCGTGCGEGCVG